MSVTKQNPNCVECTVCAHEFCVRSKSNTKNDCKCVVCWYEQNGLVELSSWWIGDQYTKHNIPLPTRDN